VGVGDREFSVGREALVLMREDEMTLSAISIFFKVPYYCSKKA
jgi:hypothetical protein